MDSVADGLRTVVRLMKLVMTLLAIGFCFSGVRSLEQYEKAVILRFGAVQGVKDDPGLVLALPAPIDELVVLDAKRTRTIEQTTFWHNLEPNADGSAPTVRAGLRPTQDGYLVTADNSILHASAVVRYQIDQLVPYAFAATDQDRLLAALVDNALINVVSTYSAEGAIARKSEVSVAVRRHLQESVANLKLGIVVDAVDLVLAWPKQVEPQITHLAAARNEAGRAKSAAQSIQQQLRIETESVRRKVLGDAQTWATQTQSRVKADAANFAKLYDLYRKNPSVIRETIYLDRMRAALAGVDELFLVDDKEGRELRLQIPRQLKRTLTK